MVKLKFSLSGISFEVICPVFKEFHSLLYDKQNLVNGGIQFSSAFIKNLGKLVVNIKSIDKSKKKTD